MRIKGFSVLCAAALLCAAAPLSGQEPDSTLSLDSLLNVQVSTAARYEQRMEQAPASVSIITAEEIARFGIQTLADALAMRRGFYTSYDHNYHYVGVRGFSRPTDYNNRVLLLVDGDPLNEPEYGSAPFGTDFPLPLSMIERIEVVRGPGSVLYGAGAMFAVVNVITRSGESGSDVQVNGELGSTSRRSGSALARHRFVDGSTLQLVLHRADVQGRNRFYPEFVQPGVSDGVARDLDGEEYQGAYLSYRKRDFLISGRASNRKKFIPTGAWQAAFNHPDTWSEDRRVAIAARLRQGLSAQTEAFFAASFEDYDYEGSYPYADVAWTDATDAHWMHGEAGLLWDISDRQRLVTGFEYNRATRVRYQTYTDYTEDYSFDVPISSGTVYSQLELKPVSQLTTVLGLSFNSRTGGIHFTSPRVAVLFQPQPATMLKFLYGHAFRAPSVYELYSDSAEIGATDAAVGLEPERIVTSEIMLERDLGHTLWLSMSVYRNEIDRLIDFVDDTAVLSDGASYRNNARSLAHGAEVGLKVREWRGNSAFVSLSYQDARDVETDEWMTNSPRFLAKAGWMKHLHDRIGMGLLMVHESGRRTLAGAKTAAFTRVDGTVTGRLLPGLSISGSLRNLLDANYAYPGGAEHVQDVLRQDGRTFLVRMEARLK